MSTIDTIGLPERRLLGVETPPVTKSGVSAFISWLSYALVKRRTRMHLSELTDAQLLDIGVSKSEARRETKRFLWD